jgi:hypothetical protein
VERTQNTVFSLVRTVLRDERKQTKEAYSRISMVDDPAVSKLFEFVKRNAGHVPERIVVRQPAEQ